MEMLISKMWSNPFFPKAKFVCFDWRMSYDSQVKKKQMYDRMGMENIQSCEITAFSFKAFTLMAVSSFV